MKKIAIRLLKSGSLMGSLVAIATAIAASATSLFAKHPALATWIVVGATALTAGSKSIQDVALELLDPEEYP